MNLLIFLIFSFIKTDANNTIHLNIIERRNDPISDYSSSGGYRIGATIDRNTTGRVILMENTTTDYERWRDKAVLGYSTFSNSQEVNYWYNGNLNADTYYCVRLVTDDNEIFYSSPYVKSGDVFVKTEGLEDLDLNNHDDFNPDGGKGYFSRHRAGIITFISLASAAVFLIAYLISKN